MLRRQFLQFLQSFALLSTLTFAGKKPENNAKIPNNEEFKIGEMVKVTLTEYKLKKGMEYPSQAAKTIFTSDKYYDKIEKVVIGPIKMKYTNIIEREGREPITTRNYIVERMDKKTWGADIIPEKRLTKIS
ncbi:hypothetical protein LCGC14_1287540 [marine sediment metagenome]|uniref:Uncharacterized protein n=1 Tax=marine sediment metagenome TaxID=412755 RepID=A0A0F9KTE4_9ZZZZ